ncbi:MAG: hypothetical protein H6812_10385 [Phycisphaeraceae bacterium]|nr:hypothetical protein [Phycisphaerales bacterium]MCB9843654.1 hypothetical protein [Phycisphaeraceae bacterium]
MPHITGERESSPLSEQTTSKQERAIIALMTESSVAAAARSAGVAERTIHTWLRDEAFRDLYRRARREAFDRAISMTQQYAAAAVKTLLQVMADKGASHQSRVSAAVALLRFGREGMELDELQERVERLEQREVIEGEATEVKR